MCIKKENILGQVRNEWCEDEKLLKGLCQYLAEKKSIKTSEYKQIFELATTTAKMDKLIHILKKKDDSCLFAILHFLQSQKSYEVYEKTFVRAWNAEKLRRKSANQDLGDSVFFLCSAVRAC